ncbi:MAG TPA: DegQ family serine endoprotease [Burkholderiales bacterium]|nr:DegQ family serine endoprotease [Burkholderiales bacterium]
MRNPASMRFAASLVALLMAACSGSENPGINQANASQAQGSAAAAAPPVAAPTRALPDFSALVERVGPAVVNVSTIRTPQNGSSQTPGMPPGAENDPFFEFFRRFGIPFDMPQPSPTMGLGSGFIISEDGYILTNAHVVKGATEVTVRLTDRREFKAKIVGADARSDVATLKIEATGLPTVRIGNPDTVKVGDWVAAIGSPFGFENSVTAGIVSAKSRSLPDSTYVPFIQTDVAVNPGNSGGPLFNMNGEVIGINSQIYSRTGGYMGLSFAIPINVAMKVRDDLVRYGKVTRGRIGVTIQDVNQALAKSFGLEKPTGAIVSSVEKGGPADKAGVQPGDIILRVGKEQVERSGELPNLVAGLQPGTKTEIVVWRNGKQTTLPLTVGELNETNVASAAGGGSESGGKLGLAVRPLSPAERKQLESEGGVVVENAQGPAARAGIRPGDVILGVNGKRIENPQELRDAVEKSDGVVALLVQRSDARIFVPVPLG